MLKSRVAAIWNSVLLFSHPILSARTCPLPDAINNVLISITGSVWPIDTNILSRLRNTLGHGPNTFIVDESFVYCKMNQLQVEPTSGDDILSINFFLVGIGYHLCFDQIVDQRQ